MRSKIIDKIMINIKNKYSHKYNSVKLKEIRYGLEAIYTIITKSLVIITISILLNFFKELLLFLIFYILLRSFAYGCHAKSNIRCWILSILLIIGLPYIFSLLYLNYSVILIIWSICFFTLFLFAPADTEKRPMKNRKKIIKFKIITIIISLLYLILMFLNKKVVSSILPAMILEAFLVSPIGYYAMGQKIRFRLN